MAVSLKQAVVRERKRELRGSPLRTAIDSADPYAVTGADLARTIQGTICWLAQRDPHARALSHPERQALGAMIAERVVRNAGRERRTGSPREVLAYIDRAWRMPYAVAQQEDRERRRMYGRTYVASIALRMIGRTGPEGREWRDCATRYTTAAQRDHDTGPMIVATAEVPPDTLAGAIARMDNGTGAPILAELPADLGALADTVAREIVGPRSAPAMRRVSAALVQASDPTALSKLAVKRGQTLGAVKVDATRGAAWLRDRYPDPADLVALVRVVAEREGLTRSPDPWRPALTGPQDAARRAVEHHVPTDCYRQPTPPERPTRKVENAPCHGTARAVLAYIAAAERKL